MAIKDYERIVKGNMGDKRFTHCKNVSKEAAALAKIYGADEEKAQLAGILHDATKEFSFERQLQIMHDGGIILDEVESVSTNLWHAISGSVYARDVLHIEDWDVLNAIRYHTSGRKNMSLLEKIIYVADYTSAERCFDGVEHMRKCARKNLDEAILFGTAYTIADLAKHNRLVHPGAVALYNEVLLKKSSRKDKN